MPEVRLGAIPKANPEWALVSEAVATETATGTIAAAHGRQIGLHSASAGQAGNFVPVYGKLQFTNTPYHAQSTSIAVNDIAFHSKDLVRIDLQTYYKTVTGVKVPQTNKCPDSIFTTNNRKYLGLETQSRSDRLLGRRTNKKMMKEAIIPRNLKAMIALGDKSEGLFIIQSGWGKL